MKLRLEKSALAAELVRLYPETFSLRSGTPCRWRPGRREGYAVAVGDGELDIAYAATGDLVLALGDLLAADRPRSLEKVPPFTFRGIMLDVSRNAAVRVDFLKDQLAALALMGLNHFCLYSEDMYAVPGEPLFGYARGRYGESDIRELVRYGKLFGVTLFPCIQTLGHMEHILKYPHYLPLKDNEAVYNVRAREVYAFIEKTIDAARAPYDTDLIHVGMDETFGLGRGLAFREDEKINPRRMYVEHVRRVAELCRRKGLKPVMWGDIVLGGAGEGGMNAREAGRIPRDMGMNYWDYAHCDERKYARDLARFHELGYRAMVSPGVWSWSRFFPAYAKAEANISSLLAAARRAGVRAALNTHWGDDGHECFFALNLPAHAYFLAECTETKDALATAKRRFAAVCRGDFDAVRSTAKIDLADYGADALLPANLGKCFFYDDPAQGLFSGLPFVRAAGPRYRALAAEMTRHAGRKTPFRPLFRFAAAFCDFLSLKSDLRRRAVAAYKKGDLRGLGLVRRDISSALRKLKLVRRLYRARWLEERSPFGLEIIEGRMGTVAARLDYLDHILGEHLRGRMPRIEEFEFRHFSMFHASRNPDYRPAVWPETMLHYSALGSRNTIKWW